MMKAYDFWHGKRFKSSSKEEKMWRALIICFFILVCLCINLVHQWATLPSPSGPFMHSTGRVADHITKNDNKTNRNIPAVKALNNSSLMQPNRNSASGTTKTTGTMKRNSEEPANNMEETPTPTLKHLEYNYEQLKKGMCKMVGRSEFCDLKGDIRIDPQSPIVYFVVPPETTVDNTTTSPLTIKPYARNNDPNAMWSVREWSIKIKAQNEQHLPPCSPPQPQDDSSSFNAAVIFSLAGYCGNMFHFMTDILVPLFATARPFDRQVRLLTTNHQDWFVPRFSKILQALSRYEVVDIDKEQQLGEKVYCFSRLTLGLKGPPNNYRELNINKTETGYTTNDFHRFLRSVFSLNETSTATKLEDNANNTTTMVPVPRLLIINRTTTRVIRNVKDVVVMATGLGFDVTVADLDTNMSRTAEIVDKCDVMMGVHGAGLTNLFFLPDNAVLIQVVPYGTEWVSRNAFGHPTEDMNLRYLAYNVEKHESSLSEQYPPDNAVFTDRDFLAKQGWSKWGHIFLDNQNVTLDLERFKGTLVQALMLLHQ